MVILDRVAAMIALLGLIVTAVLFMLALFSVAPVFCICLSLLLCVLSYFIANEASGIHHAQEFENRFWTVYAALMTSAVVYVRDSPFCFGDKRPGMAMSLVAVVGYGVHAWDRAMHRREMSRAGGMRRGSSTGRSLAKLGAAGASVEEQLDKIGLAMANIDRPLVPSAVSNVVGARFTMQNEREIIAVFEGARPEALNHLLSRVRLALVFYKVKDHRSFRGRHRTELIELLAVDRVPVLTVRSRALLLRALQLMKLPANPRAEHWVRNIILSTHLDNLSELKTITDSRGDHYCMNKLIFDDIRSETVRQDVLSHFKKEAAVQQAHMDMGTRRARLMMQKSWRKILSDVDDTLTSSGGSYPAGIDKRYAKKVVYPGVIGLYRELDLPITGPEEFPSNTGNLVFLSARPHVYKDMSEKHSFAKFQKLREREGVDGRGGLHTTPSLLAGDLSSGRQFIMTNDFEPLARKKFDNFKRFVSIYPEYKHVFICDNGQGDVRAGELIHDHFPGHLEGLFVHLVQDIQKTFGFNAERWRRNGLIDKTCFFTVYPDAALFAATHSPPFIRMHGLSRVCQDAVWDFNMISPSQWSSESQKRERRQELNQSLWRCNNVLERNGVDTVPLIESPRQWEDGEKIRTLFGIGIIRGFDRVWDLYEVELDMRPLDQQVKDYEQKESTYNEAAESQEALRSLDSKMIDRNQTLQTVVEVDESYYLSPTASFDISKKSSKQSLSGSDLAGRSTTALADEENLALFPPTPESPAQGFIFDADVFDRRASASLVPSLDESTGSSTLEEVRNVKPTYLNEFAPPSSVRAKEVTLSKNTSSISQGKFFAKIQGKDITKYTPPLLPTLPNDDKKGAKFSFWASNSANSTADKKSCTSKTKFSQGEKVTTPYGVGIVIHHRQKEQIVVVDMSGPLCARAYLQESIVKREAAGFLGTILGRFSSAQPSPHNTKGSKDWKFPYVAGTAIYSPFGGGIVIRPLPPIKEHQPSPASKAYSPEQTPKSYRPTTIAMSLTSWTLRDGRHPTLYCTADSAEKWMKKSAATNSNHQRENSLLSVIGSLVSGTVESLRKIRVPREVEASIKVESHKFERYYKDGAAVTTAYGYGTVRAFRESDGFYIVSLLMKSGKIFGTAYLLEDSMSYRLAESCVEGYPVMTTYGSGVLQSVNPTTGVHTVIIPSFGAMCYLQPNQVLRPLKAAVGEDVSTSYGEGKVCRYRLLDDKYEIKLTWGHNAMLYAKGDTFDRIDDRLEDKGGFGMGWILKLFYSREEGKEKGAQRSRSNSLCNSVSIQSNSGVSLRSGLSGLR